jgi:hypothetical protein
VKQFAIFCFSILCAFQPADGQNTPNKKSFAFVTQYLDGQENPEMQISPNLAEALKHPDDVTALKIAPDEKNLESVNKLQHLQCLYLDETFKLENYYLDQGVIGRLFKNFSTLPELKFISICDSKLIPYAASLPNLRGLQLHDFNNADWEKSGDAFTNRLELLIIDDPKPWQWPAIGQLNKLKQLEIKSLNFKSFPVDIGNLTQLRVMKVLCGNMLSLPASFQDLKALKYLEISGTPVFEEFPVQICSLVSLDELYLNLNNVRQIPESIGNLVHLKKLYLNYCKKLKEMPQSLDRLHALNELYLSQADDIKNLGGLDHTDHDFNVIMNMTPGRKLTEAMAANTHLVTLVISSRTQPYVIDKLKKDLPGKKVLTRDF